MTATLIYIVQENCEWKKLVEVLFMDAKKAFNHVSKWQLLT